VEAQLAGPNVLDGMLAQQQQARLGAQSKAGTTMHTLGGSWGDPVPGEAEYVYPTREDLMEMFGEQAVENGIMMAGGSHTRKIEKWEYPRHIGMPVCAKWKKDFTCLKFEQAGYCPFDHPQEGETNDLEEWATQKQWLEAAKHGDSATIAALLEKGTDVNLCLAPTTKDISLDLVGRTALGMAVRVGHMEVLDCLLGAPRLSLEMQQHETMSPLFAALLPVDSKAANLEAIVGKLLHARADICERDSQTGQTVLHHVLARKNFAVVEYLLKNRAQPNTNDHSGTTALAVAASRGHLPSVEALLQRKAEPGTQAQAATRPGPGPSPLGIAAHRGEVTIVKKLLATGLKPDANAWVGAMGLEDGTIKKELQRHGGSPWSRNLDGSVALHVAAKEKGAQKSLETGGTAGKADEITAKLLAFHEERGDLEAALDVVDHRGVTPLMVAARHQNGEVCKLLVNAKANTNAQDKEGNTACHHTYELEDCMWILRILIRRGKADYKIKNFAGQEPQLPNEDKTKITSGCKTQ